MKNKHLIIIIISLSRNEQAHRPQCVCVYIGDVAYVRMCVFFWGGVGVLALVAA